MFIPSVPSCCRVVATATDHSSREVLQSVCGMSECDRETTYSRPRLTQAVETRVRGRKRGGREVSSDGGSGSERGRQV